MEIEYISHIVFIIVYNIYNVNIRWGFLNQFFNYNPIQITSKIWYAPFYIILLFFILMLSIRKIYKPHRLYL